jgi:hypothetical protein
MQLLSVLYMVVASLANIPDGCKKSAVSTGNTSFCKPHGDGQRCKYHSGCTKYVVKKGMLKSHGVDAGLWN